MIKMMCDDRPILPSGSWQLWGEDWCPCGIDWSRVEKLIKRLSDPVRAGSFGLYASGKILEIHRQHALSETRPNGWLAPYSFYYVLSI